MRCARRPAEFAGLRKMALLTDPWVRSGPGGGVGGRRGRLAQANRLGRLSDRQLRAAVGELDGRCEQLDMVEIDEELARQAGDLAEAHGLRGYDAVHLAAAYRVNDADVVLVASDRPILAAALSAGLMTASIG